MPKHKKNKKKKKHNRKNKSQQRKHVQQPNKPNHNRIKEVKEIKHSPKMHHYDADHDISDSDGSHPSYNSPKPIIRSAKINQRDSFSLTRAQSNPSLISPAFDKYHNPSLLSQHQLSPLLLHRCASEPFSGSPQLSILRSPLSPSTSRSSGSNVSFDSVEVHEFELLAGSESDGVPEDGALSLYLANKEINHETLNIDIYETKRYQRWKQRAKDLHWNNKKLSKALHDPQRYLFTAGRYDEFYGSLTPKERERRLSIDKEWKKEHGSELKEEASKLNKIRKSRKTNGIFCNCKPLSKMSTSELKIVCKQYDIQIHENRKVKKGFLINQLQAKVLKYRDVCCWDRISCSCVAAGIDCHAGNKERNFQCGCVKAHKKCANKNGCYVYRQPHYNRSVITEWNEYYKNTQNKEEDVKIANKNHQTQTVSFNL